MTVWNNHLIPMPLCLNPLTYGWETVYSCHRVTKYIHTLMSLWCYCQNFSGQKFNRVVPVRGWFHMNSYKNTRRTILHFIIYIKALLFKKTMCLIAIHSEFLFHSCYMGYYIHFTWKGNSIFRQIRSILCLVMSWCLVSPYMVLTMYDRRVPVSAED